MSSAANKGVESISDTQMVEVPKDFFFEGMPLPAAIYLKMTPGHYLVIGKKGDKAAFSTFHAYNKPGVTLWVKNTEYAILISHVTGFTTKVIAQKTVPDTIKMKFLSGLTDDALRSMEKSNFTSVDKVQRVATLVTQMATQIAAFDAILDILASLPNDESKHSMTTCMVAMLLCEEMDVKLPAAQEKVAMACLLHDVGLKYLPPGMMQKPRHNWSPEELHAYEQHPIKSAEMLRDIKDISNDVLIMIVEHHENALGTGFPKKIRDIKMSPLGKIVALANYFSNLMFSTHLDGRNYSPDEAIQYIDEILGQPFNKQAFLALKNIINKKHLSDKL